MGWAMRAGVKTGPPMRSALVRSVGETIDVVNNQAEAILELRSVCEALAQRVGVLESDRGRMRVERDSLFGRIRELLRGTDV